ncbi:MAG: hypothetical protein CSB28_00715 [Desulfobacterales bacterium]|nr:MAG: hypothetical protein CSB28_00715 [Desulfobacterales bacterium]
MKVRGLTLEQFSAGQVEESPWKPNRLLISRLFIQVLRSKRFHRATGNPLGHKNFRHHIQPPRLQKQRLKTRDDDLREHTSCVFCMKPAIARNRDDWGPCVPCEGLYSSNLTTWPERKKKG